MATPAKPRTARLVVTVPETLVNQLRWAAESAGVPVSKLVERMLETASWDTTVADLAKEKS